MISVKTVSRKGKDGMSWAKLRHEFARVRKSHVKAGVLGSGTARKGQLTNAQLASINEYGLGNAPPRPWIGPPFITNRQRYFQFLVASYKKALKDGKPGDVEKALALIGQMMVADIKNYVTQGPGVPPPNSPRTIARKGSSRTLVDTSQMVNSVTYQVVPGRAIGFLGFSHGSMHGVVNK